MCLFYFFNGLRFVNLTLYHLWSTSDAVVTSEPLTLSVLGINNMS